MDIQGVGHRLHLHPGIPLSFTAVSLNSTL
jgi:hypothetical protein